MCVGLCKQFLSIIGAGLFEQNFEKDVGVNEELHSTSLRIRAISCCKSTEVYSSRIGFKAPAHSNRGAPRGFDLSFASKNSTKSRTSACSRGASSSTISSMCLTYSFIASYPALSRHCSSLHRREDCS